jgi:hypothetical protein
MSLESRDTLSASFKVAECLAFFAAFGGVVGTGAALYGIHHNPPTPKILEIDIPRQDHDLSCVGKHILKITSQDGRYNLEPIIHCSETDPLAQP